MKLAAFISLLLPLSANADDTYNFYFQKAPGPVTVNQGAAPAQPPKTELSPAPPSATPATVGEATKLEEEESYKQRAWELSIGLAIKTAPDSPLFGGQYLLGLQWNFNRFVAAQAEGYRILGRGEYSNRGFDYSAGVIVSPFRIRASSSTKLVLSGMGGAMTVPVQASYYNVASGYGSPSVRHSFTVFYGVRAALEFWNRLSLQGTLKMPVGYRDQVMSGTVAYLF